LLPKFKTRERPAPLGVAYPVATFWLQRFILQSSTTYFQSADKRAETAKNPHNRAVFQSLRRKF